MADYVLTVKIRLSDCETPLREVADRVEDATQGEFGQRMWKLGTFDYFRVTKMKETHKR